MAYTLDSAWIISVNKRPSPYTVIFRKETSRYDSEMTQIFIWKYDDLRYCGYFGIDLGRSDTPSFYWSKDGSLLIDINEHHQMAVWDLRVQEQVPSSKIKTRLEASGGKGIKIMDGGNPVNGYRLAYRSEIEELNTVYR